MGTAFEVGYDLWVKKLFARMLLVIAALYVGFALFACFLSDGMIFLPHAPSYKDSPEVLKITTAGGKKISAVYLPNLAARFTLL